MNNYRLTVHIENAERTRVETGKMIISKETKKKVAETKVKLFNTFTPSFIRLLSLFQSLI